jgi:Kef-type K+ transport system membrane component KefB
VSNLVKPDIDHQHLIVMAALMIVIVISGMLKISVLTCLLVFGLSIKIDSYKPNLHKDDLGIFSTLAYVLIFIFAGINIDLFSLKPELLLIALGVITLRVLIPFLWGFLFYRQLNISFKKAALMSVCLTPLSGIAILMLHDVNEFYPDLSLQLNNLLVMVVLIMEFSGPFLTRWAIIKSGEGRGNA